MGYIAAILSKTNDCVSSDLIKMLETASIIRGDAYGLAINGGNITTGSLENLNDKKSDAVLGHKLTKITPCDLAQPLSQYGYSMTLEGRLWNGLDTFLYSEIADIIGDDPLSGVYSLIDKGNGSYAVCTLKERTIICGRDHIGAIPIYIGESATKAGIASNKKMLWAAGLKVRSLPPGHMVEITESGISIKAIRRLSQPPTMKISMEEAVNRLDRLLIEAVEKRCRGIFRVALGFSGGIDSTLLAHYLDRAGVDVDLVCVGMAGSSEFDAAKLAAESLGLPIRLEFFTFEDVDSDLDDVLWSVEDPNPMKIGVALPIHWAVTSTEKTGSRIFFSGNMSDELFAGYHRYVQEYKESGNTVSKALFRDVAASHEVNFERDYKVCADAGVELRLPFSDLEVIKFSLSLPVELKLSRDTESPRKLILRALARKLGLPKDIALRHKRAVQYSTGVKNALRRLAKQGGKNLRDYLYERFEKVRSEKVRDLA
jgi:asparagine synthase (glutamine-hydrolysing)